MNDENQIKQRLQHDQVVYGCMLTEVRTPSVGMILERAGLDFFIIDMEHGAFSYETVSDIIAASRGLRITPFVRVPDLERQAFQKPLDAGAAGVLIPRVERREQVEQAIRYLKYAPIGERGLSLTRGHSGYQKSDPFEFTSRKNDEVMLMVQIETKNGVDNLEEIAAVPGVDVLFVGPSDLRHSYGPGPNTSDRLKEAYGKVAETGKQNGVATGVQMSDSKTIKSLVSRGMRLVSCGTEVGILISGLSGIVSEIQRHVNGT